jgi:arginase
MTNFICIGVPYYIGDRFEERTEVEAIEKSGFAAEIGAEWVTIAPDFEAAPDKLTAVNRALAEVIKAHSNWLPIVFASDCIASLGLLKGVEPKKPVVVWYDAHGDFNTDETSPSGFLGGMPLAWLVGDGNQQYMQGVDLVPVPQTDVIMIDGRDLDPGEDVRLENSQVAYLKDVNDLLTHPLPAKPLHLHIDTDVVDIKELPGMNYPAPDGPSLAEVNATLKRLATEGDVVGLSFSLWNDSLPTEGKSLAGVLGMARTVVDAMG